MFCTNCGGKVVDQAKFCASCGSPIAAPAKVLKAKAPTTQQPAGAPVEDVAAQVADEPSEIAKVSGFAKLLANKPLAIGIAAGAVLALAGSVFLLSPKGPTQDTAQNFMITAATLDFEAEVVTEVDFDGQILTGCPYKKELETLFRSGTTWASGGIKSKTGADSAFHIDQRIFEADVDTDGERIAKLLTATGETPDCSSKSSSSFLNFSFDYTNPRTVQEAFGVNVNGAVIDTNTRICLKTCNTTNGQIIVANRGKVTMLFQYRGSNEYGVGFDDLKAVVTSALTKFAG